MRTFIFYIFVITIFCCCNPPTLPNLQNPCYEREHVYEFDQHFIQVPYDVVPNKKIYKIGETISFKFKVSKNLFDANLRDSIELIDFPFAPGFYLYRFEKTLPFEDIAEVYSGIALNTVNIDNVYSTYSRTDSRGPYIGFYFNFDGEFYTFNVDVELETEGKYLFLIREGINSYEGSILTDSLDQAIINFPSEDKCEDYRMYIQYKVQGDNDLALMRKELKYLDDGLWYGTLCSIDDDYYSDGLSFWVIEDLGTFGFEVVE